MSASKEQSRSAPSTRRARWFGRSRLVDVLLTVAGTNRAILRVAPKEQTKQVAMGAVLVSTAAIASVSAAYALHLALHLPVLLAMAGGAAWGLVILNLDRWLVVSTPRLATRWGTLAMALPRVLLAVLIGAVVSMPLTLAVFGAEIETEIAVMAREDQETFGDQLADDTRYSGLDAQEERIATLEQELREGPSEADVLLDQGVVNAQSRYDEVSTQYGAAVAAALCERDGTCGTGDPGFGAATQQKEAEAERLRAEREQLAAEVLVLKEQARERLAAEDELQDADARVELDDLRSKVAELRDQRRAEIAAHSAAVDDSDGILARLSALERIQEDDPALGAAHLLLFLFMTALECLPIIFKTMLALAPPSLYERLVLLEEEKTEGRVRLRMQTEYEEAETLARSSVAAAEARAARTLEAESRATGIVLDAQLDVTRESVRRWRDEELGQRSSTGEVLAGAARARVLEDDLAVPDWFDEQLTGAPGAAEQ